MPWPWLPTWRWPNARAPATSWPRCFASSTRSGLGRRCAAHSPTPVPTYQGWHRSSILSQRTTILHEDPVTKPAHPSFNLGMLIAVASLCLGVLSACGVQETAQSRAAKASPQAAATTTLVPYEATQESRRATSMARVANDIATSEALPTPEVWPT